MTVLLSNPGTFAEGLVLDDGYLPVIFTVMLEAWSRVKIPSKKTSEPQITALWKIQCRIVNKEQYSEGGSRFDFFHEEQENDPTTGKQILRKDIEIRLYDDGPCSSIKRNAPYLVIESKKLAKISDLAGYIGKDGMLCFIERKYDCFKSYSAMAAYIMEGAIDDFKAPLLEKIRNAEKLYTKNVQPSWSILSVFPIHRTTQHTVEAKSVITTYFSKRRC